MLEGLLIFVSGLFLGIILTVAIFFILRKQFENVRTPSDDAAFARFREEKEALEKKSQELEQEIQRFQKVMGNQASSPQERSPQFTEMREQIKEQEALIHSLKSTLQNVKGRLKSDRT
ncbi:hypothetical protein K8I28_14445 [bacterium]|nr:hypothetical protein [bacterium]